MKKCRKNAGKKVKKKRTSNRFLKQSASLCFPVVQTMHAFRETMESRKFDEKDVRGFWE